MGEAVEHEADHGQVTIASETSGSIS